MVTQEEAKLITHGSIAGVLFGQLDELVPTDMTYHKEVKAIIGKALDIVQDNYHLVPKVTLNTDDNVTESPVPEDAITDVLSNYWNEVSN